MRLLGSLARATRQDWGEGALWVSFTLVFGLLPVYGGALLLVLLRSRVSWSRFADRGEFAIYAAGLLAAALLVVFHEYKVGFPERAMLGLFTVFLLVLAALLFFLAFAADAAPGLAENVNRGVVRLLSLLVYVAAVALAFLLAVMKEALQQPNMEGIRAERMRRLESDFDRLEGGA